MSTQTQTTLFQPGSVNEVLNAIKIELHKDISDVRFSYIINDDKMLELLAQQFIKGYFVLSFLPDSDIGSSLQFSGET